MRPNTGGGYTLEHHEIPVAQWAAANFMPTAFESVDDEIRRWHQETASCSLELGPRTAVALLDTVQQGVDMGTMPLQYHQTARNMLIDGGRENPTFGYRLRRFGRRLLEYISDDV